MAADHAPFGTDVQPDFETVIRSSRRFDVPVYRSLRERLEDHGQTTEYSKQLFEPATAPGQGYSPWNNYPMLPPVKQFAHSTSPERYHNQNDLNIGHQLKKVLEEYDRGNFKEMYALAFESDPSGSGRLHEEAMRVVFLRCRLPLSGRVMEALFDRFRISNGQIDYEKMLKFLDKSYELFSPREQHAKDILPQPQERAGGKSETKNSVDMDTTSSSKMLYQDDTRARYKAEVPRLDMAPVRNRNEAEQYLSPRGRTEISPDADIYYPRNYTGPVDENIEDAHLLLLLVKHFMAENKMINLKALKHAFFVADTSKQGLLSKIQTSEILSKYRFDLETWLLEALLGRCDLKDNGLISWVALVEFIDRVQPLVCKKLSPRHIRSSIVPTIPRGASLGEYSQRKVMEETRPFTWPMKDATHPSVPVLPPIETKQQPQVTNALNLSPRFNNLSPVRGTMLPPIRDKIVNVDPWMIPSGPSTNRSQLPMPSKRPDDRHMDNSHNPAKERLIKSKITATGAPWLNRYRHLEEALNKSDLDRKGLLDSTIVRRLVSTYNVVFALGLNMGAVEQHLNANRYPDGRIPINPLIVDMRSAKIPHSTL